MPSRLSCGGIYLSLGNLPGYAANETVRWRGTLRFGPPATDRTDVHSMRTCNRRSSWTRSRACRRIRCVHAKPRRKSRHSGNVEVPESERHRLRGGFDEDVFAFDRTRPVCPSELFDDLVLLGDL